MNFLLKRLARPIAHSRVRFDSVVGHDDKKELIRRCLNAEKPVHCLLYGSPASGKTLFLEELAQLPSAYFVVGSNLSRAGIFQVLFDRQPRYLLLDEIDKVKSGENLSVLLSLMENGRITETKHNRHRDLTLKTWVFAGANKTDNLSRELLSRFTKLYFRDYSEAEYFEVAVGVLRSRENVPEGLAVQIAKAVSESLGPKDIRDVVRVARLLERQTVEDVHKVVQVLKMQQEVKTSTIHSHTLSGSY